MHYEGKIYRPWPEANSLLIQTTLGCTHNKCTFCDMFRKKRFRIRKIDEIAKELILAIKIGKNKKQNTTQHQKKTIIKYNFFFF